MRQDAPARQRHASGVIVAHAQPHDSPAAVEFIPTAQHPRIGTSDEAVGIAHQALQPPRAKVLQDIVHIGPDFEAVVESAVPVAPQGQLVGRRGARSPGRTLRMGDVHRASSRNGGPHQGLPVRFPLGVRQLTRAQDQEMIAGVRTHFGADDRQHPAVPPLQAVGASRQRVVIAQDEKIKARLARRGQNLFNGVRPVRVRAVQMDRAAQFIQVVQVVVHVCGTDKRQVKKLRRVVQAYRAGAWGSRRRSPMNTIPKF